jgi:Glycosyltransferase WbsX
MVSPFKQKSYPSITPMWDNSARRKINYFILHNSTPQKYKVWLLYIINNFRWESMPESFLFINAWNEWAEGNHLEPCQKWGKEFLEATKEALYSNIKTF